MGFPPWKIEMGRIKPKIYPDFTHETEKCHPGRQLERIATLGGSPRSGNFSSRRYAINLFVLDTIVDLSEADTPHPARFFTLTVNHHTTGLGSNA
jgi:hypothetical protein